jgi:SAM-dependent methyltransferase
MAARNPAPGPASLREERVPSLASRVARYATFDRMNRPYLEWQLADFRPVLGRRVLEIGCGVGGILDLIGSREAVLGVDVDPEVLGYARQRFAGRAEVELACADLGDPASEGLLSAFAPDTIVCINVLEHVRDDLAALQRLERVLAPGGHLCLLVPAHLALYGAYDRTDGHFRRYSRAHLRLLLSHTGLEVLRLRYFNALGALGWWVNYKLLRRSIHGGAQFGLMNQAIPLARRIERWAPPPFGLSVSALCRRAAV